MQGKCQPETCSQMTDSQWVFQCLFVHEKPKYCPAIDYIRHTLDGAADLLHEYGFYLKKVIALFHIFASQSLFAK